MLEHLLECVGLKILQNLLEEERQFVGKDIDFFKMLVQFVGKD